MITPDDLVKYKSESHNIFASYYEFILIDIQNDLRSKTDYKNRILAKYGEFDEKARIMIVRQFVKVLEFSESNELMRVFNLQNLSEENFSLEDKYVNELLDNF